MRSCGFMIHSCFVGCLWLRASLCLFGLHYVMVRDESLSVWVLAELVYGAGFLFLFFFAAVLFSCCDLCIYIYIQLLESYWQLVRSELLNTLVLEDVCWGQRRGLISLVIGCLETERWVYKEGNNLYKIWSILFKDILQYMTYFIEVSWDLDKFALV